MKQPTVGLIITQITLKYLPLSQVMKQPSLFISFAARTILDGQYSSLMLAVTIFWRQSVSSYNVFNVLLTETHLLIGLLVTSYYTCRYDPLYKNIQPAFYCCINVSLDFFYKSPNRCNM
jgi:hypothetical protein